jgi:BioD-like phosphotransacetylase family protein
MTKARDTARPGIRFAKELGAEAVADVNQTDDHLVEILARIARRIAQTAPDSGQSQ